MSALATKSRGGWRERWRFRRACRTNDDAWLARWSDPIAALKHELSRQNVAIVGNARALAKGESGALIDAADLVVRINRAPMPSPRSHGRRTDWLALATTLSPADAQRLNPQRLLWMSHKRKRLKYWMARRPGFFLYPMRDFEALRKQLGAPPTTGLMIIDFISRSEVERIDLFGFDFFASRSLTGRRGAHQVPHDFAAEKAWLERLMRLDRRIILHPMP